MIETYAAPPQPAKWTLLLYSAADNDQKDYNVLNVTELETVGSDAYTHLVAQVDTGDACSRYLLQKVVSPDPAHIQSPALETTGPMNMSDPKSLADFVTWGMKSYPAEHTMVIISDHGSGWQGAVEDDSHEGWMDLPSIRQALEGAQAETGKKVDIVGFDACLMGATEVAHELKDVTDFVVGSQDYEESAGWPYTRIFNSGLVEAMQQMHLSKVDLDARQLAVTCVREAATRPDDLPTMTAVDTAKMPTLTQAVNDMGHAILAQSGCSGAVGAAADGALKFDEFHDLGDFARRVAADASIDGSVRTAATSVASALSEAVIAEQHAPRHEGAHGLTIEASTRGVPEGYAETRFARETCWPQVLERLERGQGASTRSSVSYW